jgi:phenylpropionate dioxygenase-like ring-hydroxylating dioxygenase large terminal subunit
VAQRAGIIWVIPDVDCADHDVNAHLGDFAGELDRMGFNTHVSYAPRKLDLNCNWKLIVDGALEAYHVKFAHRPTIATMFADNAQVVDANGLNQRLFFIKERLRDVREDGEIQLREVGNFQYYIFPSTVILVHPDHTQVTRLDPLGVNGTQIHDFALIPQQPENDRAREHWDRNVQLYRDTLGEDYAQMESIQVGLASGANESLRFGRYEFALARFHEQLDAELDADKAPRLDRSMPLKQ